MATRRMISKNISTSRKVNRLSCFAALLYTWIIPHTDDYGCMDGDWVSVKAKVVPMQETTDKQIEKALKEIEAAGLITRYWHAGEQYLQVTNFETFQTFKTDRQRQSEYPSPEKADGNQEFPNGNQRIPTDETAGKFVRLREGKIREGNLREDNNPSPRTRVAGKQKEEKVKTPVTQTEGALINQTMEGFMKVNDNYDLIVKNTNQRKALDRLIIRHSAEKVKKAIEMLPFSNQQPYAPTITTPVQLEHRLPTLIAWWQKEQGKKVEKGKEIIGL